MQYCNGLTALIYIHDTEAKRSTLTLGGRLQRLRQADGGRGFGGRGRLHPLLAAAGPRGQVRADGRPLGGGALREEALSLLPGGGARRQAAVGGGGLHLVALRGDRPQGHSGGNHSTEYILKVVSELS